MKNIEIKNCCLPPPRFPNNNPPEDVDEDDK